MKKIISLLIITMLFTACQEEGVLTQKVENSAAIPTSGLEYQGVFKPTSGINASGNALIYLENGQYKLILENFSVTSGPDLKVYLSKSATTQDFVNLGSLNNSAVYLIPKTVNVADFSHLLIHCQEYNHLFAIATLTKK